ncbi:hypothetical protein ABZU76_22100 [Amycolatopsis sp. NPDC005232]|uniref:hypothetical protein n=1 Tax=unclassified Amycolatopsis TaxID=2618356 RepID=UPI001C69E496|nr:hypothetical protein [Amycolatopsis sp. DSM 110486]QYN22506.1 hypothetical protein K1T34_08545 [Amycolatopsis sp. DSM 110486]
MGQVLPVEFSDGEVRELERQAAAEGRSLQEYVRETLMTAVTSRARQRATVLDHVLEASAGLNERLAR